MRKQFENLIFKNEPDETTPISAENLNLIQANIENALKDKFDFNTSSVSDANSIFDTGIYLATSNAQNFPFNTGDVIDEGNLAWLIVLGESSLGATTQIATENGSLDYWARSSKGDSAEDGWNDWKQLTTPKSAILSITKSRGAINIPIAWETVKMNCETSNVSSDDRLTFSDGAVKIGKNVNRILASLHTGGVQRTGGGDKVIKILKNGDTIDVSYISGENPADWQEMNISPIIIDVEEGDIISIGVDWALTGNLNFLKTTLTVEVVD